MSEQRPKTARPSPNRPARPVTAKVRPATAKPAFNESAINPYIQEIQNKLKSPDFAPSLSDPVLMEFHPSSPSRAGQKKVVIGLLEEKLPDPTPQTAHKRYSSVYPCSSKILAKKWDDATWKKHKEKIKTMKACIDNVHSAEQPSILRSLKKSITKQENEKRIIRENEILLERMARTFTKPSAFTNFEEAHARTKKDLDNKSKANLRKREQANERIDKENEILLKRLQNKRANYEKKQWLVERREHLRHLLNMTKFPEAYTTAVKREHLNEHRKTPVGHILKPESPAPPSLAATKSADAYAAQSETKGSKSAISAKSKDSISTHKSKTASKSSISRSVAPTAEKEHNNQYADDFHETTAAHPSDHYADDFEAPAIAV